MSDILIQAALSEQQRLTEELIEAKASAAQAAAIAQASALSGNSGTSESQMYSLGTYAYDATAWTCRRALPTIRHGSWPTHDLLCKLRNPRQALNEIRELYINTFSEFNKPKEYGMFFFDQAYGRCGGSCNWTVPAGVSRVHVQMWGPGGGSAGVQCQGIMMPGPVGSYGTFEIDVTPGDIFCTCWGCAYCCVQVDPGNTPGYNNGYCTTVCYVDNALSTNTLWTASGSPDPNVCLMNCHFSHAHGACTGCWYHFGGNYSIRNEIELDTQIGCVCFYNTNWVCLNGMQACGPWSNCYQGQVYGGFIPPSYDSLCSFCTNASMLYYANKRVEFYGVPASWPGFWAGNSCCLGSPYGGAHDGWAISLPVVGFEYTSGQVVAPNNYDQDEVYPVNSSCCSQACISPGYCMGYLKAPSAGGTGYFSRSCGVYYGSNGRGGAICLSWNCD